MSDGPKQQAYDRHIAPLVAQIIGLCQQYRITTMMHFTLDNIGSK